MISNDSDSLNGMGLRELSFKSLFGHLVFCLPHALALGLLSSLMIILSSLPGGIVYIFFATKPIGNKWLLLRMNLMTEKISIVVPIYNERENIQSFVAALTAALVSTDEDYEVLLINDGSNGRQEALLDRFPEQDSKIRVYIFEENHLETGPGAGFDHGNRKHIYSHGCDMQNDPEDLYRQFWPNCVKDMNVVSCWRRIARRLALRNSPPGSNKLFLY